MKTSQSGANRVQVKVCGIREPADAASLDAMGVEWLGFNFHRGSARYVAPEAAAPIIRALGKAEPVGVFVDADPDFVIEVTAYTGIRHVQLHGSEDWDYVRRMTVPVLKAIPHDRLADLGGLRDSLESLLHPNPTAGSRTGADQVGARLAPLAYFLVDTQAALAGKPGPAGASAGSVAAAAGPGGFGGSGMTFDWALLRDYPPPRPYFLAGGLGPHNLAKALAACTPFAVDLNSKVELSPGRKDLAKVRACLDILGRK